MSVHLSRRFSIAFLSTSAFLFAESALPLQATASSSSVEWLKYFNPLPQKNYLNESQDRAIKKTTFKANDMPNAQAIPNKEIGLFAEVSAAEIKDPELLKGLLANEKVNGLSTIISWRELEPSEGHYNWQLIDDVLDICATKNKSLLLRISTCGLDDSTGAGQSDTPKWVFDAGVKSLSYTGIDHNPHQMPVFWDAAYLAKWSNFVNALGQKYDKNQNIQSIGITGGGILGGTQIVPDFVHSEANYQVLQNELKADDGLGQRQLVEHWKYVADLFPKAFPTARLNFDIDPPILSRAGQEALDVISDYLVLRYGERIFLTRQNVSDAKHGFDQYRILLKFKSDTLTGYQLTDKVASEDWPRLVKNSLDDGVSFVEVPAKVFASTDQVLQEALAIWQSHLGYQLLSQQVSMPTDIKSGEPLKVSFSFVNLGSASPKRPIRQLDKDIASSYQIGIELRDVTGKPVVLTVQTPPVPTTNWTAGKAIKWDDQFRLPKLPAGEYSVWLSILNKETKTRLQIRGAQPNDTEESAQLGTTIAVGKLQVLPD